MRILGIETSGSIADAALLEEGGVVAAGRLRVRGRTGERLVDLVDSLLQWADWELGTVNRIAVDIGPGSFTGLRVGLALAKGLSLGSGIPVEPVSSLAALAARLEGDDPVLAALSAPKGRVYAALLQRRSDRFETLIEEACWEPSELRAEISAHLTSGGKRGVLAGPGLVRLGLLKMPGGKEWRSYPELIPSAETVALCGGGTLGKGRVGNELAALVPRYLKGADVRRPRIQSESQPRG